MTVELKRDKEYIKANIERKGGTFYTKKRCTIEFPSWYFDKKLASFQEDISFFGIFAIIIDGKYSVSVISTICRSNPIAIGNIKRGDVEYTQLEFGPGDPILVSENVIKEELKSYDFFNNYFIRSNVPWFMAYDDLAKAMSNLFKYGGSNVGVNPLANELIVSFVTRSEKDPMIYYRQTDMRGPYEFVNLMNLFYSVKSTVNKITGGYFQTGILSALTIEEEKPSSMEVHLKG